MKNYILALVSVSIISGVLEILTPAGVGDGIKKHIRLICALCVLCVLISPVINLLNELSDGDITLDGWYDGAKEEDYRAVFEENLASHSANTVAEGVKGLICSDFSLDSDDVRVSVFLAEDKVDRAVIILSGSSVLQDPRELESYVFSLLGADVETVYE